jgi:hypothetical protein
MMTWENPIKVARLCFFKTGRSKEHFALVADEGAVDRLLSFLKESDAVISELENYSADEIATLQEAKGRAGRSLFAVPGCFQGQTGANNICRRACALPPHA